mgnify:CR=1 FL=1|jgi:TPR repeat protein
MRKLTSTLYLTVVVLLGSAGMSWSADFQTGLDAYNHGDYANALYEWTHFAEQGDALAQSSLGLLYVNAQNYLQDNVRAHMWFNIAALNENGEEAIREDASSRRETIESEMTPAQIAEAQNLARECVRKNYKGC